MLLGFVDNFELCHYICDSLRLTVPFFFCILFFLNFCSKELILSLYFEPSCLSIPRELWYDMRKYLHWRNYA